MAVNQTVRCGPGRFLRNAHSSAFLLSFATSCMLPFSYFAVLRVDQIADFEAGSAVDGFVTNFGTAMLGDWGLVLLSICIALSTFSAANGSAFSGGRLLYTAALNGDFPKALTKLYICSRPRLPLPIQRLVACLMLSPALLSSPLLLLPPSSFLPPNPVCAFRYLRVCCVCPSMLAMSAGFGAPESSIATW